MHAPQSREAQAAREGAQRGENQRGHVVPTGRNADMVKWGDHVERIGTDYVQNTVSPVLVQLAAEVAQGQKPEAQEAMVRLAIYANRIPLVAASEIAQTERPDLIARAVNDNQTGTLITSVQHYAPWVTASLINQLREVLSDKAVWNNVIMPAAEQTGGP